MQLIAIIDNFGQYHTITPSLPHELLLGARHDFEKSYREPMSQVNVTLFAELRSPQYPFPTTGDL